jgi:hypothetical protein
MRTNTGFDGSEAISFLGKSMGGSKRNSSNRRRTVQLTLKQLKVLLRNAWMNGRNSWLRENFPREARSRGPKGGA